MTDIFYDIEQLSSHTEFVSALRGGFTFKEFIEGFYGVHDNRQIDIILGRPIQEVLFEKEKTKRKLMIK